MATRIRLVLLLGARHRIVFLLIMSRLLVALELFLRGVTRDVIALEVLGGVLGQILGRVGSLDFRMIFKYATVCGLDVIASLSFIFGYAYVLITHDL